MVSFSGVEKRYSATDVALDGISFDIYPGEFVFLVGPTGCGKSTCIRLLMKELEATSGIVSVAGRSLNDITPKRLPYLRRNIGVIFQDYKLLPNRTVYANVGYALEVIGESRESIRRKVPDILRLVGLSTKLHNYPDELSGGEQQRVSIARAFVNHPPLLLCDEPTGNLDSATSKDIMALFHELHAEGNTIVIVTHEPSVASQCPRAIRIVDARRRRVIELDHGMLVRDQARGVYGVGT